MQFNDTSLRNSSFSDVWGPKRDPLYIVIPFTVVYSLIFVTGVVGNVSTCVVISRNRHMHTATNYYLFSLAISDLLLLVAGLPKEMYILWSKFPFVFGETVCLLLALASETSTNASVLTITAFTVERYVAICHPFLTHTVSKLSRAIKFVIAIWILAFLFALPQALQFGFVYATHENGTKISEEYKVCGVKKWLPYTFEISTVLFFFAPMSVITVLYILIGVRLHKSTGRKAQRLRDSRRGVGNSKSTTRVVKMLVVVVVAFFICWAPFQAQRLLALHITDDTSSTVLFLYHTIEYPSGVLYYLSTTINPFLYNIMSLKFREAFKSTLIRCFQNREILRSEVGGGSSIGPMGPSPRYTYSVLSHRSMRNSNNNNSCSSGNSFIDQMDLHRRPLVVSFKRKGAQTSPSLNMICPEAKEFLHVPQRLDSCPKFHVQTEPANKKTRNGDLKIPRIEDIEIFQETQLRIERRKSRRQDEAQSCSIEEKKSETEETFVLVKKSHTVPCLVIK